MTAMNLTSVAYEFFDFEEADPEATVLERGLRLGFADAPTVYISWTWERQYDDTCEPYSIGWRTTPYHGEEPDRLVEASRSSLWAPLIGQEVELSYVDADCLVMRVHSYNYQVYCWARGIDTVSMGKEPPR
jgi:hypothetical protein